ncbi:MAG TPA: sulfur carrier protein ThiS [Blastocatellia bacterium]|nr:sulfur carrier protein ThiS [Blastocatellia bacterium]
MKIVLNGSEADVPDGAGIRDVIAALDLIPERVAVEVNRRILRRQEWDSITLAEGDAVEIVHFVGGGN